GHGAPGRARRCPRVDGEDVRQRDGEEQEGEHHHGAHHELVAPELADLLMKDRPDAPVHRCASTSSSTSSRYTSSSEWEPSVSCSRSAPDETMARARGGAATRGSRTVMR